MQIITKKQFNKRINEYPCLYLKNPLNLLNYNKLLRQTKLFVSCYLSGKYIHLRYICEHSLTNITNKEIFLQPFGQKLVIQDDSPKNIIRIFSLKYLLNMIHRKYRLR